MNVIDEWIDTDGAQRDALKFKHACEERKALIDDIKVQINKAYEDITMYACDDQVCAFASRVCKILDNIGKAESEDKE